jgi:hypothetical protein
LIGDLDAFVSKYGFGLLFIISGLFVASVGGIGYFIWRMEGGSVLIFIGLFFLGTGLLLMTITKLFNPTSITGILKE